MSHHHPAYDIVAQYAPDGSICGFRRVPRLALALPPGRYWQPFRGGGVSAGEPRPGVAAGAGAGRGGAASARGRKGRAVNMADKYTKFRDIPRFTDWGGYAVDVGWDYL